MSTATPEAGAPYLLRVVLPDRPGGLGELAAAIGAAGGDIVRFDIVERVQGPSGEEVVDDFVIVLPAGSAPGLHAELAALEGFVVETLRPYEAVGGPDEADPYDAVVHGASSGAALALIASVGAQAFKAGWAMVLEHGPAAVVTLVGTKDAPVLRWAELPWIPLDEPTSLELDDGWVPVDWAHREVALAAAPIAGTDLVLLVGRPGGPRFREAEVARLGRLSTVASVASRGEDGRVAGLA